MEPKPSRVHLQSESLESSRQDTELQHTQTPLAALEFATVEEMLRYDVAQIQPPPSVAARLRDAIAAERPRPLPWWRRWFSGRGKM